MTISQKRHAFHQLNRGENSMQTTKIQKRGVCLVAAVLATCAASAALAADNGFQVLYSFTGGSDGAYPSAGLTSDSAGNLYSTTPYGGLGNGVVFKLAPDGAETTLYAF